MRRFLATYAAIEALLLACVALVLVCGLLFGLAGVGLGLIAALAVFTVGAIGVLRRMGQP